MVKPAYASIRECRAADVAHFDELGSQLHIEHCRNELERMRRGEAVVLVAVDENDLPVGKVHIDFAGQAESTATIGAAAVAPSLQSRGIGTALVEAAEAAIRARGLAFAELGVEDANTRAQSLYVRLGYRPIADETFSYVVESADGTPTRVSNRGARMRKRLASEAAVTR